MKPLSTRPRSRIAVFRDADITAGRRRAVCGDHGVPADKRRCRAATGGKTSLTADAKQAASPGAPSDRRKWAVRAPPTANTRACRRRAAKALIVADSYPRAGTRRVGRAVWIQWTILLDIPSRRSTFAAASHPSVATPACLKRVENVPGGPTPDECKSRHALRRSETRPHPCP